MSCLDDAAILELLDGALAPAALVAADEHLDACASCRDVVATVARARGAGTPLARGQPIGRYVIGELVGAGAMGRVYSAWQPELDRRVAIKVLREDRDRARLLAEAQAMARLDHPNVVGVHEIGETGDGVFVAMELVDGDTLRAWAAARLRSWREIAAALVDVARGLAAVHAAGVVHRDVKPDNVIVGVDGRARLGDFGLARARGERDVQPALAIGSGSTVAGTPAYMAPELLRGARADAASDQFAFGVTAYEVLAGTRPFAGTTWSELARAADAEQVRSLRGVPRWLDAAIRRCFAAAPARRFPSMQAVADWLAAQLARRRPIAWLAGAGAAAIAAAVGTWLVVARDRVEVPDCAIGARELAAVWTAGARDALDRAWANSPARAPALAALDAWTRGWRDERDATCRDAATAPPARVAARERCLDQRRAELGALVAPLADKGADRALDALAILAQPAECRFADADPLPLEPERALAVRRIANGLAEVRAAVALGDARGVPAKASALVELARATNHEPTLADALLANADVLRATERFDVAAATARDAVAAAERGHADELAARAWIARVAIAGERRDLDAADDLGAIAAAAVVRAGSPPHLVAVVTRARGLVAMNRGRLDEARALLVDARARFAALGEPSIDVAAVDSALGSVARAAGDLDEAERRHRAALAADRALRGPAHADVARDLHNLAGVLRLRGNLDGALATYRDALAIEIATRGDTSAAAGLTRNSIGLVLMARGDWSAARTELEGARDALVAADAGDRAFAEHNLGLVAQATGDHRGALDHFARAAAVYGVTIGDAAAAPIRLLVDRARSELALGDPTAARADARRAGERARVAQIAWIADDADQLARTIVTRAPIVATRVAPVEPPLQPLPVPEKPAPPPPPPPKPRRDVGVYGPSQGWP